MKLLFKSAALASGLVLASVMAPTAVFAQAPAKGAVASGIGIADFDAIVYNSNAAKTARDQRQTTYKAQIDQAKAHKAQVEGQLQALGAKIKAASEAPTPDRNAINLQVQQYQQMQQAGEQQLQQILRPVSLSEAYVNEQIDDKMEQAIKTAMEKKGVTLLLSPQAVLAMTNGAYLINQDILNELNAAIPAAQLVPPEGWEPREMREARARQAAAAQQPAGAAQAAPSGR